MTKAAKDTFAGLQTNFLGEIFSTPVTSINISVSKKFYSFKSLHAKISKKSQDRGMLLPEKFIIFPLPTVYHVKLYDGYLNFIKINTKIKICYASKQFKNTKIN